MNFDRSKHLSEHGFVATVYVGIALSILIVAGCNTIGSVTTPKTLCGPAGSGKAFQPITYSGLRDTSTTKRQIRVHNRTGQNIGCWK